INLPNKRLCIVGEGPLRKELEHLAEQLGEKDSVSFFGFRDDRICLLKGFDVFVLPSKLEGIPRCLLEAMAANVPVIATDIPGCAALVRHGKTGMLFHVDDQSDLADKLLLLLADSELRNLLTIAARGLVEREHSAKEMAKQYADLYLEITGRK